MIMGLLLLLQVRECMSRQGWLLILVVLTVLERVVILLGAVMLTLVPLYLMSWLSVLCMKWNSDLL